MKKLIRNVLTAAVIMALLTCTFTVPSIAHKDGGCLGDVPRTDVAVEIDAERDKIYDYGLTVDVKEEKDRPVLATGTVTLLYSGGVIYAFAEVTDSDVQTPKSDARSESPWLTDSFEIFINLPNNSNVNDVMQYRIDCDGYPTVYNKAGLRAYGEKAASEYFRYAAKRTSYGYCAEFAIPADAPGQEIGVNFQINDIHGEEGELTWAVVYSVAMDGGTDSWYVNVYPYLSLGAYSSASESGLTVEATQVPTEVPVETPEPDGENGNGGSNGGEQSGNDKAGQLSAGVIAAICAGAAALIAACVIVCIVVKKKKAQVNENGQAREKEE